MSISCDIIQDLIPLVIDQVASEDSIQLVKEHIIDCQQCRAMYEEMKRPSLSKGKEAGLLKRMQKTMLMKEALLLAIGIALVNYMIGDGYLLFMNILVLPIIGAGSYFILRSKWYYALIGVAVFMAVYTISSALVVPYHYFSEVFFILPALLLTLLGVGIGALLFYAFAKEERYHEEKK